MRYFLQILFMIFITPLLQLAGIVVAESTFGTVVVASYWSLVAMNLSVLAIIGVVVLTVTVILFVIAREFLKEIIKS